MALPPRFFVSRGAAAATAAVATIQHSGESRLLPAAESCTCASFWCCCGGRAERITGFCLRNGLKVKLKLAVTARSWHLAASLNSNITRLGRPRRAACADALAKRPKSAPVSTAIRRAGLEGRRKTNPVVDGQLVPKPPRKPSSRKRRRDESGAPPSPPSRRRASDPPPPLERVEIDRLAAYLEGRRQG